MVIDARFGTFAATQRDPEVARARSEHGIMHARAGIRFIEHRSTRKPDFIGPAYLKVILVVPEVPVLL